MEDAAMLHRKLPAITTSRLPSSSVLLGRVARDAGPFSELLQEIREYMMKMNLKIYSMEDRRGNFKCHLGFVKLFLELASTM